MHLLLGLLFVLASLWGCGGGSGPVDAASSLDTKPRPDAEGIDTNPKADAWVGSEASFHEAAFEDGPEGGAFVTDATQDAGPVDGFIAPDGSGPCAFISLGELRVDNFELHEAAPLHAGRSFRIAAHTILPSGCHLRAMPLVEIDSSSRTVWINLRSWIEGGSYCTLAITPDIRFITLRLSEGMWTIRSRRGDASLVVDVESAPALPCAPSGGAACRQDCDCRPNERCLSTWGFAGPVLECIEPCEEDLDCSERGEVCLQTSSDWFDHVCTGTGKNCTHPGRPCPESYECDGERCKPTFVLNSSTRRECRCNADCPRGLRCVRAGARGRCEAICPTGGRFCPPQHACAQASEDRSGLALSDSVCVWLGE